jgi:hypothetical protein
MNRILLSWPDEKIIYELQQILVENGILAIINPMQPEPHIIHHMLVVSESDFKAAISFITTNHKSLGLPSELWEQFKQRTGNEL